MATAPEWVPPAEDPAREVRILVLNHHRDELDTEVQALEQRGYEVAETQSIIETHRVLAKERPHLILLNPLVLQAGSVELEVLEDLQRDDDPVPVVILLDPMEADTPLRGRLRRHDFLARPWFDFLTRPYSTDELLLRVDLLLSHRRKLLELHRRTRELEGQVLEDYKTGLINDRHFKALLAIEFKRAQRHAEPLSLLLVDVDDFKSVNDTTEYAFGDEVLVHVARCLKQTIRVTDFAARFGGDEFALLLPHTSPEEAVKTANRVRRAVRSLTVRSGGYEKQVTVSIGIGTFDGRTRSAIDELRRQANKALHEAKQLGKDRVGLYSE